MILLENRVRFVFLGELSTALTIVIFPIQVGSSGVFKHRLTFVIVTFILTFSLSTKLFVRVNSLYILSTNSVFQQIQISYLH